MRTAKRLTAMLLILAMAVSMIACGKGEAPKVDVSEVKTLADTLKAAEKYSRGIVEAKLDVSVKPGEALGEMGDVSYTADISGKVYNHDAAIEKFTENLSVAYKDKTYKMNGTCRNPLVLKDKVLYINLETIANSVLKSNYDLGNYGLLLPDYDTKTVDNIKNDYSGMLSELGAAFLENFKVSGENGEYTIELNDAEKVMPAIEAFIDKAKDNTGAIKNLAGDVMSLADFDMEAYLNDLFDDNIDGVKKIMEISGQPIEDGVEDALREQLLNAVDAEGYRDGIKEVAKEIEGSSDDDMKASLDEALDDLRSGEAEDLAEAFKKLNPVLKISAKENNYSVSLALNGEVRGIEINVNASVSLRLSNILVSKPTDIKKLDKIAEYVNDNKDEIMDTLQGVADKLSDAGSMDEVLSAASDTFGCGFIAAVLTPSLVKYIAKARQVKERQKQLEDEYEYQHETNPKDDDADDDDYYYNFE